MALEMGKRRMGMQRVDRGYIAALFLIVWGIGRWGKQGCGVNEVVITGCVPGKMVPA